MTIAVLTPNKEIFAGEIKGVKVPGIAGYFEVLQNHAPIVSALGKGHVTIHQKEGEAMTFEIEKGFIEVLNNEVALLVQGVKE